MMNLGKVFMEELSSQTIIYVPYGGSNRSISATVHYLGPQNMAGLRGGSRPHAEILVRNSSTYGISAKEIDTARDKVQIALRYGRSTRTISITKIMDQDKAMMRLLCY